MASTLQVWLYALSLGLLIGGGLLWGVIGLLKVNPLDVLGSRLFPQLLRGLYMLVGLAAVYHLMRRDTYLPFLGPAAFPCGSLKEATPDGATVAVTVTTGRPQATVVFWAAEPGDSHAPADLPRPYDAYGAHRNAGVTRTDAQGVATLRVRRPGPYKVGVQGKRLDPHIHYRLCDGRGGWLERVATVEVPPS